MAELADVLKQTSFHQLDHLVRKKVILTIQGFEKTGKSHFALTGPEPVLVFNFDNGLDRVKGSFPGKNIHTSTYKFTSKDSAESYDLAWQQFKHDFLTVAKANVGGTIVVDTEGEAYELARLAEFDRKKVAPAEYQTVYTELHELYAEALNTNSNVVFIRHMTENWGMVPNSSGGQRLSPLGTYRAVGYSRLSQITEANLEAYVNDDGEFAVKVLNAGYNAKLRGREMIGQLANMTTLLEWMFKGLEVA